MKVSVVRPSSVRLSAFSNDIRSREADSFHISHMEGGNEKLFFFAPIG